MSLDNPSKAERQWREDIIRVGCIACIVSGHEPSPGVQHHLLRGGQRISHMDSICLCEPGHHQGGDQKTKISRHPWRREFVKAYGPEEWLLSETRRRVQELRAQSVGHGEREAA